MSDPRYISSQKGLFSNPPVDPTKPNHGRRTYGFSALNLDSQQLVEWAINILKRTDSPSPQIVNEVIELLEEALK